LRISLFFLLFFFFFLLMIRAVFRVPSPWSFALKGRGSFPLLLQPPSLLGGPLLSPFQCAVFWAVRLGLLIFSRPLRGGFGQPQAFFMACFDFCFPVPRQFFFFFFQLIWNSRGVALFPLWLPVCFPLFLFPQKVRTVLATQLFLPDDRLKVMFPCHPYQHFPQFAFALFSDLNGSLVFAGPT